MPVDIITHFSSVSCRVSLLIRSSLSTYAELVEVLWGHGNVTFRNMKNRPFRGGFILSLRKTFPLKRNSKQHCEKHKICCNDKYALRFDRCISKSVYQDA